MRHEGRAYNLVKLDKYVKIKKQGGLGISQLDETNTILLLKWWWKTVESPDKEVCKLLRENIHQQTKDEGGQINCKQASQFWQGL